jgi:hypothetical protein
MIQYGTRPNLDMETTDSSKESHSWVGAFNVAISHAVVGSLQPAHSNGLVSVTPHSGPGRPSLFGRLPSCCLADYLQVRPGSTPSRFCQGPRPAYQHPLGSIRRELSRVWDVIRKPSWTPWFVVAGRRNGLGTVSGSCRARPRESFTPCCLSNCHVSQ